MKYLILMLFLCGCNYSGYFPYGKVYKVEKNNNGCYCKVMFDSSGDEVSFYKWFVCPCNTVYGDTLKICKK